MCKIFFRRYWNLVVNFILNWYRGHSYFSLAMDTIWPTLNQQMAKCAISYFDIWYTTLLTSSFCGFPTFFANQPVTPTSHSAFLVYFIFIWFSHFQPSKTNRQHEHDWFIYWVQILSHQKGQCFSKDKWRSRRLQPTQTTAMLIWQACDLGFWTWSASGSRARVDFKDFCHCNLYQQVMILM